MAKIKYTKNELKAQRDALNRFRRFLPLLELKREQLHLEMQRVDAAIAEKKAAETDLLEDIGRWIRLFAEDIDFAGYLRVTEIKQSVSNIAGLAIPIFEEVVIAGDPVNLYDTPAWLDDGLKALKQLIRLHAEQQVLKEQHRLLSEELLITTQRVNLFEKVKIPEAADNIRIIRIFLGDQDAAAVVRAKIAKRKVTVLLKSA